MEQIRRGSSALPLQPQASQHGTGRRLADLTVVALILAGLGFALGLVSGIGLPVAIAGVICGAIAARRRPADQPWPLLAAAVSGFSAVVAAILLVVAAQAWLPAPQG